MNGTGIKGGAFGFRVSSINKVSGILSERRHLIIRLPSLLIPSP